jgi:hypothetical protein
MPIEPRWYYINDKLLLEDDKVASHEDCCCQEGCCPPYNYSKIRVTINCPAQSLEAGFHATGYGYPTSCLWNRVYNPLFGPCDAWWASDETAFYTFDDLSATIDIPFDVNCVLNEVRLYLGNVTISKTLQVFHDGIQLSTGQGDPPDYGLDCKNLSGWDCSHDPRTLTTSLSCTFGVYFQSRYDNLYGVGAYRCNLEIGAAPGYAECVYTPGFTVASPALHPLGDHAWYGQGDFPEQRTYFDYIEPHRELLPDFQKDWQTSLAPIIDAFGAPCANVSSTSQLKVNKWSGANSSIIYGGALLPNYCKCAGLKTVSTYNGTMSWVPLL